MKNTGIVRKIDELGRITLPIELRKTLGINVGDPLVISLEGEKVILEKYENEPRCCKCGDPIDVKFMVNDGDDYICKDCLMAFIDLMEN